MGNRKEAARGRSGASLVLYQEEDVADVGAHDPLVVPVHTAEGFLQDT